MHGKNCYTGLKMQVSPAFFIFRVPAFVLRPVCRNARNV